jgi:hypothetical protein
MPKRMNDKDTPDANDPNAWKNLTLQERCDRANAHAQSIGRHDIRWVILFGRLEIEQINAAPIGMASRTSSRDLMARRGEPMSRENTDRLNAQIEKLGGHARYRPDGSRYSLKPDEDTGAWRNSPRITKEGAAAPFSELELTDRMDADIRSYGVALGYLEVVDGKPREVMPGDRPPDLCGQAVADDADADLDERFGPK